MDDRARAPRFSRRTAWEAEQNALTRALARARASGQELVDLTESNPTRCGLGPGPELVAELGDARGTSYEPLPLGHPTAREAVARYYAERGCPVDPGRVVVCASTSEAYAWLLKLLTERGDRVLVPEPSYPLLPFVARLEDVELSPYPLPRDEGFRVDVDAARAALDERTAAVVVVHPNNPTGTFVRRSDAAALARAAASVGAALICDEVFGDYAWGELGADRLPTFAGGTQALTFVLSGLSKVLAAPQLKLGWIVVTGPEALARAAIHRLEIVADTYLSVATGVQLALPALLSGRRAVQDRIRERVAMNLDALDSTVAELGASVGARRLRADGGWYALLEVPRTRDDESWAVSLVDEERVAVHPGYFFDMHDRATLVVSLLPRPEVFADAARRLVGFLARNA